MLLQLFRVASNGTNKWSQWYLSCGLLLSLIIIFDPQFALSQFEAHTLSYDRAGSFSNTVVRTSNAPLVLLLLLIVELLPINPINFPSSSKTIEINVPQSPPPSPRYRGRWSEKTLESYRQHQDMLSDNLMAIAKELPLESKGLVEWLNDSVRKSEEEERKFFEFSDEPAVRSFVQQAYQKPDWLDVNKLKLARDLAFRQSILSGASILMSLIETYTFVPLNKVLLGTGRLERNTERRIYETAAMVWDVVHDGILPLQKGHTTLLKVRLLHSRVRNYIRLNSNILKWDKSWGKPINQEDMAATIMTFSQTFCRGLERMGVALTKEEKDSIQHLWRYAGYILGVEENLLCKSFEEEYDLYSSVRKHIRNPDSNSIALTDAAIDAVSLQPYLLYAPGWAIRMFLGHVSDEPVAKILKFPRNGVSNGLMWILERFFVITNHLQNHSPWFKDLSIRFGIWFLGTNLRIFLNGVIPDYQFKTA